MNRPPWSLGAKALWAFLAALVGPLWTWATWLRLRGSLHLIQDFAQEWLSARNFFAGQPIYAPLSESIPRHLGPGWRVGLLDVNAHPPGSVLFALPWGGLDYHAAYFTWIALSLVALALALYLVVSRLELSAWALLPIGTVLVISNSLAQELNQGQWNSLLTLLIVGAWASLRSDPRPGGRGEVAAGALLGLAAALKLYPGFLLLYLAAGRRWRGLGVGLGVALGWNALALAVLGPQAIRSYVVEVLPALARFRDFWPNASLPGLASKLFVGASGHVEPLVVSPLAADSLTTVSVLALAGLVVRQAARARRQPAEHDLAFSLCVVGMLLVSPVAWDHYFLVLGLPLAALWIHTPEGSWKRSVVVLSTVGLLIVNPAWIYRWLLPGPGELAYLHGLEATVATPWQTVTVLSFQLYLLLLLGVALHSAVLDAGGREVYSPET
jgi:hypothetical protein